MEECCTDPGSCGGLRKTLEMQPHMLCVAPANACDDDGRLTRLTLASERLRCSFPAAAVRRLQGLQRLDLTFNQIGGRCGGTESGTVNTEYHRLLYSFSTLGCALL